MGKSLARNRLGNRKLLTGLLGKNFLGKSFLILYTRTCRHNFLVYKLYEYCTFVLVCAEKFAGVTASSKFFSPCRSLSERLAALVRLSAQCAVPSVAAFVTSEATPRSPRASGDGDGACERPPVRSESSELRVHCTAHTLMNSRDEPLESSRGAHFANPNQLCLRKCLFRVLLLLSFSSPSARLAFVALAAAAATWRQIAVAGSRTLVPRDAMRCHFACASSRRARAASPFQCDLLCRRRETRVRRRSTRRISPLEYSHFGESNKEP